MVILLAAEDSGVDTRTHQVSPNVFVGPDRGTSSSDAVGAEHRPVVGGVWAVGDEVAQPAELRERLVRYGTITGSGASSTGGLSVALRNADRAASGLAVEGTCRRSRSVPSPRHRGVHCE